MLKLYLNGRDHETKLIVYVIRRLWKLHNISLLPRFTWYLGDRRVLRQWVLNCNWSVYNIHHYNNIQIDSESLEFWCSALSILKIN